MSEKMTAVLITAQGRTEQAEGTVEEIATRCKAEKAAAALMDADGKPAGAIDRHGKVTRF